MEGDRYMSLRWKTGRVRERKEEDPKLYFMCADGERAIARDR